MDTLTKIPYISVCIPTYEMNGQGRGYLRDSLKVLSTQSFKNFDVIISDNSKDRQIELLCEEFKDDLVIKYIKNHHSFGISVNLNNAIKNANGKIIKILFQDDYLYSNKSLEDIATKFKLDKDFWMVTASEHTYDGVNCYRKFIPKFSERILLGINTISSPSVLTIKNSNSNPIFDENLTWLMDCDYYYQLYLVYGCPVTLNEVNVVNRTGAHQVSNSIVTRAMKAAEFRYLGKKYAKHLSIMSKLILFLKYFR